MAVTILEVLQNAEYNLCQGEIAVQHTIGKEQLHNAVTLLRKGYGLQEEFDEVMRPYEDVESVPDKA